jgi:hypothetical protein
LKNHRSLLFFIFFLLFKSYIHAQQSEQKIALRSILSRIEQQHLVNFNYIDDDIVGLTSFMPDKDTDLKSKLNFISKQVPIEFTFIDSRTITITITKKNNKRIYCGLLLDIQNNSPIAGATIISREFNTSYSSDATGFFEIKSSNFKTIIICSVGYETVSVSSKSFGTSCITIAMTPKIQELDEVFTQPYLTKGITKLEDGTVKVVPSKFGLLPGLVEADVFMTMQQLPGVMSIDETVSNTNVRGGTHDQNLFLWNGIKLYQTAHFFGLISAINPNLSNSISITKNGTSSGYGEGVSSLVEITSRSKSSDKSKFSFGANMLNVDGYLRFSPWKKASLEIAGRRSNSQFFDTPTFKNYRDRIFQNTTLTDLSSNENIKVSTQDTFSFYDVALLFSQEICSKTAFHLDALLIDNSLNVNQELTSSIGLEKNTNTIFQKSIGLAASLQRDWSKNNRLNLLFYGTFYRINALNEVALNEQVLNQENSVFETGIKLNNTSNIGENWKFNNGFQFNEIGIKNQDNINVPQYFRRIIDVLKTYVTYHEIVLLSNESSNWQGRFGVRNNYFNELKQFRIEPRLQLNYKWRNAFTVALLAEQKSQTTTQVIDLQQDFLGLENRRWILANNQDIPIQTSNQVSIGFSFVKRNWLLQWDTFYKKVNGITSSAQGFQNQLEFLKITGNYTTVGSELLLQKSFSFITAYLSYTLHNSEYQFVSYITPQFSNNFEVNHNISSGISFNYKTVKVALGSRWYTGRPNTLPLSLSPVFNIPNVATIDYDLPNRVNLDDYFQINFSSSYTKKWRKATLQLGVAVLNLFDKRNPINRHFRLNNDQSSVEEITTFGLARTINTFFKMEL